MRMTVKEAFDQKVKQPGLRLFYQGKLVWQLRRDLFKDGQFVVQFDKRGLALAHPDGGDVIEVEENVSTVIGKTETSGVNNLFNTIASTTDELGKAYEEIAQLKAEAYRLRQALQQIARPERWTNFPEQMLSDIRQIARKALKDTEE